MLGAQGTKENYLQASLWPTHPLTVLADAYRAVGKFELATETASRALKLANELLEWGI